MIKIGLDGSYRDHCPARPVGTLMRGSDSRTARIERLSVCITVFGLAVVSYLRGFPGFIETPYWFLTYKSGFIRRGFVGTFVSPFIVGIPLPDAIIFICLVCTLIAAVYLAVIAILTTVVYESIKSRTQQFLWLGLIAVALVSPGLPMLDYDFGTLDTVIALIAILVTIAVFRQAFWVAILLSAAGPLVHEAFFFLTLPLIGSIWWGWSDRRRTAIAAAAVIILVTLMIWHFSTADFLWQPGVPLAQSDLDAFAGWQLGQHVVFMNFPDVAVSVWLWAFGSTASMCGLLWPLVPGRRLWACARVLVGALFTVSILVIGSDTERFLDWICLTTPVLCGLEVLKHGCQSRQGPSRSARQRPPSNREAPGLPTKG